MSQVPEAVLLACASVCACVLDVCVCERGWEMEVLVGTPAEEQQEQVDPGNHVLKVKSVGPEVLGGVGDF